jgi:hypothetical protein
MSKFLPDDPRGFVEFLRTRTEGHAPGYDIAIYGRPHQWQAIATEIESLRAKLREAEEKRVVSQSWEREQMLGCLRDRDDKLCAAAADEIDALAVLVEKAEAALSDTLNMLRAAHMQCGVQHDANKRVIKARETLDQCRKAMLSTEVAK